MGRRNRSRWEQAAAVKEHLLIRTLTDAYMRKNNLTLKALANRCKVSAIVLRRIRNGPTLYLEDVFTVAKGLDMPPEKLMKKLEAVSPPNR